MEYDFDFKSPDKLYITYHLKTEDKDFSFDCVWLGKQAGYALACHLLPKVEQLTNFSCADRFYGQLLGGIMSITDLPAQYYMSVYHAIMQACDEIDSLTPYKDALNKALMADPRFQTKQAA